MSENLKEINKRLIQAIDLAIFFRGTLPPLAHAQCVSVIEPLLDVLNELGIEPGASFNPPTEKEP
jgi:hypothetical protein